MARRYKVGYRSKIRVVTTFEGFKAMREIAFEIAKKNGIPSVILLFPAHETEKEFYDYCATWEDCGCVLMSVEDFNKD